MEVELRPENGGRVPVCETGRPLASFLGTGMVRMCHGKDDSHERESRDGVEASKCRKFSERPFPFQVRRPTPNDHSQIGNEQGPDVPSSNKISCMGLRKNERSGHGTGNPHCRQQILSNVEAYYPQGDLRGGGDSFFFFHRKCSLCPACNRE